MIVSLVSLEDLADINVMEGVLIGRPMHLLVTAYLPTLQLLSSLILAVLKRIRVKLEVG